ncbi:MAG: hypothetical protein KDE45_20515, partial [Caldilineaceae bacterium]|nr:hypothetical protein [Caldilineaceae bacterium]
MPAKVDGVIGKRLDRLDADLLEILRVAGVEGEQFTAEIVAAVLGVTSQDVVRRLSGDLAKRHRLVLPHGIRRLDGRLLSLYRFRHNLFQQYLLQNLDEVERAHIHARMGMAMETLYASDPDELSAHAGQIALHLEAGGFVDKAVGYWQQAGEEAVRLSANEEAVHSFTQALRLLRTLPESEPRTMRELRLQLSLGVPISAVQGYSDHATAKVYRRAYLLSRRTGRLEEEFPSLYGLWRYHLIRSQLQPAQRTAERLLVLAEELGQPPVVLEALRAVGVTYYHRGLPAQADAYLARSLALYERERDGTHAFLYGHDPAISCYSYLACALWLQGQDEAALRRVHEGLALARLLDHPFSLAHVLLNGAAHLHIMRRDYAAAHTVAEAAFTVATRHRFPQWTGYANVLLGRALVGQGAVQKGIEHMRAGLATLD